MAERIELQTGTTQLTLPCEYTNITLPNGVKIRVSFNEDDDGGLVEVLSEDGEDHLRILHSDSGQVVMGRRTPVPHTPPSEHPQEVS